MILVCGEALIDLFVGPREGTELPARADVGLNVHGLSCHFNRDTAGEKCLTHEATLGPLKAEAC